MRGRDAEERHDRVADELLDRPAEALQLRPDPGPVRREKRAGVFRVERFRNGREVEQLSDEDRDDLPLLPRPAPASRRRRSRAGEGGVVLEDPAVKRAQLVARFDPELLDERPPHLTVGGERVRLPARAVEREHELGAEVLAEGMLRDQLLELGDQLAGSPEREVGLETILQRSEAKLLQAPDLGRDGVLVEDVLERFASPKAKGLPEQLGRPGGIVTERRSRRAREALEATRIELVGLDPKHVARRPLRQDRAWGSFRPAGLEDPAELRDVEPELAAGVRRVVGPEHVDDPVHRDHFLRLHQEQRE